MRAGKILLALSALIIIGAPVTTRPQPPVWGKIRPAASTMAEVEKIFGTSFERDHYIRHVTEEGVYFFSFSDGVCVTKWKEEWNAKLGGLPPLKEGTPLSDWDLPEWTVEKVSYMPNDWIPIAELGIDLSKLKKINRSPHTPGIFDYDDKIRGVSYEVQYDYKRVGRRVRAIPMLTGVRLFPAARYSNRLCR